MSTSSSCRTRAAHRSDRRSDPRALRTCASRDAAVPRRHLRRHNPVTAEHLFKVASLPCARRAEPPHHCRAARHGCRHRRALIPRHSRHPITRALSIGPLGAPNVACCPTHVLHSPELWSPRPSSSVAVVRHRRVPPRPNSEHQRPFGEHALIPAPLHGRERRRPRRNWPSRAAPMAKGHIARPPLSRVFVANRGHGCDTSNLCRVLSAIGYLH
jgi:hypothetical protein